MVSSAKTRLGGRYTLQEQLAETDFSTVFAAEDAEARRRVCIKLLRSERLADDPEASLRFRREAEILSRLSHPHVVGVFDFGEDEGTPYLVMELLEGRSLEQLLEDEGALPLRVAARILRQAADGLAHVHRSGVLHLDIKPSNIFVVGEGEEVSARLIDFGFAGEKPETEAAVVGTLRYMAPEQAGLIRRPVTAAADLYGLGGVAYEALTGRPPFDGEHVGSVLRQIQCDPPAPVRNLAPEVPIVLEHIVHTLLRKNPDDRYGTTEGLLVDLERIDRELAAGRAAPSFALSTAGGVLAERLGRVFVGRRAQLQLAAEHAARAAGGEPQLLMVAGATGTGKTAFVEQLVTRLQEDGAELAQGKGSSIHTGLHFAAIEEALAQLHALVERRPERDQVARRVKDRVGDRAGDLVRLCPAWADIVGDAPAAPYAGVQAERDRAMAVVADVIGAAAPPDGTLVFFLDDLQWADARTDELLLQLLDALVGERVLLIGAYRSDEIEPDHALAALGENDDERALQLSLEDLSVDDVAELLKQLANTAPPDALLEDVFERSGGNAFFLWELVRAYVRAGVIVTEGDASRFDLDALQGVELPRDLVEAVLGRLADLPEEARRVLGVAALYGRPFGLPLLSACVDIEEEQIFEALRAAVDAQLLEELPEEGRRLYAFAHDKVAVACAAFVPLEERATRHRAFCEHLENIVASDGDEAPAELLFGLAFHSARAGDPERALLHLKRAAGIALGLHQNERAVEMYEEADGILNSLGRGRADAERLALAEKMADALDAMGRYEDSEALYRRVLDATEDPLETARILARLAHGSQKRGNFAEMHANLVQALKILGVTVHLQGTTRGWSATREHWRSKLPLGGEQLSDERFSLVAEILTRLWYFHSFHDLGKNNWKMVYLANKLLALAKPRGASRELAVACRTMSITHCQGAKPDFPAALRNAFRGVEVARQLKAKMELAEALSYVGMVYVWHARSGEAVEYLERARRLFEQIGNKWEMANVHIFLFMARRSMGELEAALGHALEIVKIAKRANAAGSMASGFYKVGELLLLQGEEKNGEQYIERAIEIAEENGLQFDLYMSLKTRGQARLRRGLYTEAKEDFERAIDLNETNQFMRAYVYDGYIGWAEAVLREQLRGGATKPSSAEVALAGRRLDDAVHAEERSQLHLVYALRVRALFHAVRGDPRLALEEAELALTIAQEGERKLEVPSVLEVLAELVRGEDEERTKTLLTDARAAWEAAGATAEAARVDEQLRELVGDDAAVVDDSASLALAQARRQADALLRVSLASSSALDADAQARAALDELIDVMSADRALLFALAEDGSLELIAGRHQEGGDIATPVGSSSTIVERARELKQAVVVTGEDESAALGSKSAIIYDLRSIMAAPLMVQDRLLGVVYLDNNLDRGIRTRQDAQLLQAIANHIAIAMETTRTARLELEQQALEQERALLAQNLALTGAVQALFLPPAGAHVVGGAKVAGSHRSADESGGDWWWLHEAEGRVRVIVGDVTGHGAAAAMLTASMAAVVRHASRLSPQPSPPELAQALHDVLGDLSRGEYLMTLSIVEIDPEAGALRWWNAGAPPLLVHRDGGRLQVLNATGVPVGGARFALEAVEVDFAPGDRAMVYTDGIVEQPIRSGRPFGRRALAKSFTKVPAVEDVGPAVFAALDDSMGDQVQDDDHTVVIIGL
jgi:serine phosphatase RsbU (regulator of sigma subunit)/tRNA A-37 threonylcarbamoyl transferase component Bud32